MKRLVLLAFLIIFSCSKDSDVSDTPPPIVKYTLNVTASPTEGGLVNPQSGSYNPGETVTIIASPNQYYGFDKWTGSWNGIENQVTITMDSNKNIVGNFIKVDNDEDGVLNSNDSCAGTPQGASVDSNGCGLSQLDSDGDGVTDDIDLCANTDTSAAIIGSNGCEVSLFYLADNGITIKAIDEAQIGMQQEFEGSIYTVVSENQLRQMVDNNEEVFYVVTSKITNLSRLFQFKGSPYGVSRWDVSNVTDMSFMFAGYYVFNLDISHWDVSNVTNMKGMFYSIPVDLSQTTSDNQIPLFLPYSVVASVVLAGIYNQYPSLQPILQPFFAVYVGPNSNEFVELGEAVAADLTPFLNDIYSNALIQNYQELATQLGYPFSVLASGDLAAAGVPALATAIDNAVFPIIGLLKSRFDSGENYYRGSFNRNIGSWNVSNVTDMSFMFYHSEFNQDISNWDVSNVTAMKYMFGRANDFNQNLESWDVSNVTDCSSFDVNSNMNWTESNKPNFTNCNPD